MYKITKKFFLEELVPELVRLIATVNQDYMIWQALSQTSRNVNNILKGLGIFLGINCYSGSLSRLTSNKRRIARKYMTPDKWFGLNSFLAESLTQNPDTIIQYEFDDHIIKCAKCEKTEGSDTESFVYDLFYDIVFCDGTKVNSLRKEKNDQWSHAETFVVDFYEKKPITLQIDLGKWGSQEFIYMNIIWVYQHERVSLKFKNGVPEWCVWCFTKVQDFQELLSSFSEVKSILPVIMQHIAKSEFSNNVFLAITKTIESLKFPKLVLSRVKNMNDQNSKMLTSILQKRLGVE